VVRNAVVPERDIASLPLESGVELWARSNNLVEQRDDVVTLSLWHTNDLGDKARVEEYTLPACDGVCADERMLGGDGLTTNGATQLT
jgi:hypothetical protein